MKSSWVGQRKVRLLSLSESFRVEEASWCQETNPQIHTSTNYFGSHLNPLGRPVIFVQQFKLRSATKRNCGGPNAGTVQFFTGTRQAVADRTGCCSDQRACSSSRPELASKSVYRHLRHLYISIPMLQFGNPTTGTQPLFQLTINRHCGIQILLLTLSLEVWASTAPGVCLALACFFGRFASSAY
ncbi:hypothetical protein VTL71DRAFT_6998 [Oculimacula yallundae]|uniref:Uncharacterized protein n=1 Tax=Oculimacula yallundae TaxID=86028 RepID=A0ABR4BWY0_9HELO